MKRDKTGQDPMRFDWNQHHAVRPDKARHEISSDAGQVSERSGRDRSRSVRSARCASVGLSGVQKVVLT